MPKRTDVHAFVDESYRRHYLLVAALVPPPALTDLRRCGRELLPSGQRRLHMQTERDSRRRDILSTYARAGATTRLYICGTADSPAVRATGLRRIVQDLSDQRATRLVIESRAWRDEADRWGMASAAPSR